MTTLEQTTEEEIKKVNITDFVTDKAYDEYVANLTASLTRVAKASVEECLPEEDRPRLGSENQDVYVTYANGYNQARQETLNSFRTFMGENK